MNIKDIITESQHTCPHCGGPVVEYSDLMEKKDACYYKVKASAKVWPSAYASGRLVQCRKKGAGNYGNKSEGVAEGFNDVAQMVVNGIAMSYFFWLLFRWFKNKVLSPDERLGVNRDLNLNSGRDRVYKVYINSKDVSSKVLTKNEAFEVVKSMAKETHDPNTYFTIYNTDTKAIEFRHNVGTGESMDEQGAAEAQLDEKCWDGYQQQGMKNKGGRQVPNCVSAESIVEDSDNKCPPATQDITLNLKNRQKAIDDYGYGPLNPDMPNTKFWMKKVDEWNLDSVDEAKSSLCGNCAAFDIRQHTLDCIAQGIDSDSPADAAGVIDAGEMGYCKFLKFKCASRRTCDAWVTGGPLRDKPNAEEGLTEEFDLIESIIEGIAEQNGVDAEAVWEDLESLTEDELYAFAVTSQLNEDWQKANKRDRTAGMSQKAVNAYRRENPGSKLKTAVTTKPSKLKRGSKASKRRKSYCSRSRGQMKMHSISCAKTPDKAICKARRRWNC
jgi:hypothetical protein